MLPLKETINEIKKDIIYMLFSLIIFFSMITVGNNEVKIVKSRPVI